MTLFNLFFGRFSLLGIGGYHPQAFQMEQRIITGDFRIPLAF
jgi:hypothetical protein